MNAIEPPPSSDIDDQSLGGVDSGSSYAGFWRRTAAAAIDAAIVLLPFSLGVYLLFPAQIVTLAHDPPPPSTGYLVFLAAYLLLTIAYMAGFESSARQATPGKHLLAIRVTDLGLRRISFLRAVKRGWFYWLPMALVLIDSVAGFMVFALVSLIVALVSCLAVAFTERNQALHDIVAGCLLLYDPQSATAAAQGNA